MVIAMEIELEFEWKDYATCAQFEFPVDENPFFVEGYGATYDKARPYCARCPVVIDCLIDALDDPDNLGMWGCTSPNERSEILDMMEAGYSLKAAAEFVWDRQRRRRNGAVVPSKSVWSEWDA